MTNWKWYWKVKKKHTAKDLCSWYSTINSFDLFRSKQGIEAVRNSKDQISFEIPQYKLKAVLMSDDSLQVTYNDGSYVIPVEKKSCNYGGFYRFFHCPECKTRMRKLYCIQGRFVCRKCANLGYYVQRLRPSDRYMHLRMKAEQRLYNMAGSLYTKPPWQKEHTFQKLRKKYLNCDEKHFYALYNELISWYGPGVRYLLDSHYSLSVSFDFHRLYDYK